MLARRPNTKLQDHPFSAVRDCLFNIIATTFHTEGRYSIRNLRTSHAVVTGTHLTHGRVMLEDLICEVITSIRITVCIVYKIMLEIKLLMLFHYFSNTIFLCYISVDLN
jgi:hypothetical protein